MKIAVIASNINKISSQTKQGTAIFISNLVGQLVKTTDVTLYCSLDSEVPVKKSGIINRASSEDSNIGIRTPNTYFDSALISKALQEDQHDLYHFNNEEISQSSTKPMFSNIRHTSFFSQLTQWLFNLVLGADQQNILASCHLFGDKRPGLIHLFLGFG